MALRSPISSAFSYGFTYDVFLSFRGSDTRYGFAGNFYRALCDRGIRAFIDDRELQGGDEITPSLVNAIKDSMIFIPVFSINYASSSFCLDELVHIVECSKEKGRVVLPVFYGVDPSHVRHQTGSYGEALAEREVRFQNNKEKHEDNIKRLQKWKMALKHVANLSGQHFRISLGNEYEFEFIRKIVDEVSNKINRAPLHVADYPVGLKSRLLKVNSLLDVGSDDEVCMVGIHGIGGIGKTTLARAIYNLIADHFEGLCFLDDVREKSSKHGLVHLQETLLYETVREKDIKLGSVNKGIPIIRQWLHRKKVLLILDDVDELKQLQTMAGGLDWFGLGSKVIVTTRDKLLLASHGIERTYEVCGLETEEALELLMWKAFKNNIVDSSYEDVLNRAVTYASGLPLGLEVVGFNLFGKKVEEWKSTLDRYGRIPNKKIQKILKVSFDGLEEDEQSVFLDIACCFKGYELAEVEDIIHAHYCYCMKHQLGVLVEKSLIKISQCNYVTLHDLIEDMGKEIVRQESPKEPGKRSRLWFHEDIVQVLDENKGTSQIEILYLDFPLFEEVDWKGDELKKMENLKTLIIKSGCFSKGPIHLPNSLRVLEWHRYPSREMPSDFCPKKLSICKLQESCVTSIELPRSLKRFRNMRELNLDNCQCLTQIHDVSGLQNLETFSFRRCENLVTIHNSLGFLNKLKWLDAESCIKLGRFPPLALTSLQHLTLSGCISLKSFPEILAKMEQISYIRLELTSIEEFPLSFQNLTRINHFRIWQCGMLRLPSSIPMMPNVLKLGFPQCNLPDEFLPVILAWFANVKELDLSVSNFTILPECIKECRFLRHLILDDCKCLREIRGIPPNLKSLSALHCESLTSSCRSMLLNQELHEAGGTFFRLAGIARIPEWFEHQNVGPSISFWYRNKLPSVALFFVSKLTHITCPLGQFLLVSVKLFINGYKYVLHYPFEFDVLNVTLNHTYLYDLQLQERELESKLNKALLKDEWIHVEVRYQNRVPVLIESGIHVFKQKSSMEDIQFTNPYKNREKLDDSDSSDNSEDDIDGVDDDSDEGVDNDSINDGNDYSVDKSDSDDSDEGVDSDDGENNNINSSIDDDDIDEDNNGDDVYDSDEGVDNDSIDDGNDDSVNESDSISDIDSDGEDSDEGVNSDNIDDSDNNNVNNSFDEDVDIVDEDNNGDGVYYSQ